MQKRLEITWKEKKRGDDDFQNVAVRMRKTLVRKIDDIAAKTNRSRGNVITLLLESVIDDVEVKGKQE